MSIKLTRGQKMPEISESEAKRLAQERRERRAKKRYEQNKKAIDKANEDLKFRISRRTLEIMDAGMANFKLGKVSDPIDLEGV